MKRIILAAVCLAVIAGGGNTLSAQEARTLTIEQRLAVYAPVKITVPWDLLDKNETAALENLYRAGVVMDELFLRQVWKGNVELRSALTSKGLTKDLKFFNINFGPWDRINENEPFIGKVMKPDGYNVGLNLGRTAGAGLEEHLHFHIVPRWNGDTNFMPVFADVKVIPQALGELYAKLKSSMTQ